MIAAACAATLYAGGQLQIKRGLQKGARRRRAIATTNYAMMLWSLPLFFIASGDFSMGVLLFTVCAGAALFTGRILSVNALHAGDLSIVGPLLGMKTLLVACFSFLTGQAEVTAMLWTAAGLVTVGVMLLQRGPKQLYKNRRKAALYAFGASLLFALCDILVVEAKQWGNWGIGMRVPVLFITVACLTPLLGKPAKPPAEASKPILLGSLIMGFQTFFVVMLIGLTGEALLINIVYCTRALWTVIFDRWKGKGEGVEEFFASRMVGAVFVVAAIVIVIFN